VQRLRFNRGRRGGGTVALVARPSGVDSGVVEGGSASRTATRIAAQSELRHQLNSSTVLMTRTVRERTNSGRELTYAARSNG
jgi:hypothetical protein